MGKGGSGGGGKKGGGTPSAPKPSINPQFGGGSFSGLEMAGQDTSNYINSLLNPLASAYNWASGIATSGAAPGLPENPSGGEPFTGQSLNFYNYSPYETYGSQGQITHADQINPSMLAQQPVSATAGEPASTGTAPASTGAVTSATTGAATPNAPQMASALEAGASIPEFQNWFNQNMGKTVYINGQPIQLTQDNPTQVLQAAQNQTISYQPSPPTMLQQAQQGLTNMETTASTPPPGLDYGSISTLEKKFFGQADPSKIPGGTLPASGLYPDQEALVDAQTKAAQAATSQQEANMGLSASTQGAELSGEIGQQGAAEKGQLIQGNLQIAQNAQSIAQNWAKMGMGEQTLGMAEQQQTFQQFAQISQLSQAEQKQMWDEAMGGAGMLGTFVNTLLNSYGISNQQAGFEFQAEEAYSQAQAGIDQAAVQASGQSSSSGGSSMMSGLASIVGALAMAGVFCWVAREVIPERWTEFRNWVVLKSPGWFRILYVRYGERFAKWIRNRPLAKRFVRALMLFILKYA